LLRLLHSFSRLCRPLLFLSFVFCYPATTEIYPLSLHDALPISIPVFVTSMMFCASTCSASEARANTPIGRVRPSRVVTSPVPPRSEEHTSELQSRFDLVCRLLLEKKKKQIYGWSHAYSSLRQTV